MLEFGIVNFWVYVLGAFAVIIAPGPNSLFVLKTAVTEGRRPALAGALAVLVGDSVLITCSFVGVAAMLAAHPDLFMWVRTAGGLYLARLGFKILYSVYAKTKTAAGEDRETVRNSAEKRSAGAFKAFRTALILSLTNPKAILFFVAFFVQFIDPAFEAKWIPYLILAAVLQFFSISWLLFLTTLGADALRAVARFPAMAKLGNTAIGGLFLLFAGKLVLD